MKQFEIRLFGAFQTSQDGSLSLSFRTSKALALFVYLICQPEQAYFRETLGEMLWPDRPAKTTRACLRQALHYIKIAITAQSVPYRLLNSLSAIRLISTEAVWLDTGEFEHLNTQINDHHPAGTLLCLECARRTRSMAELYRGDFMAGFTLPDAPHLDWWLFNKRELYLDQILSALARLEEHYESGADYPSALQTCQKEIELDASREAAHLRYMRLLAMTGQRGKALHHYEICRKILQQDLDIEPSSELQILYQQIHEGRLGTIIE